MIGNQRLRFAEFFQGALAQGPSLEPTSLLNAIRASEDPLRDLQDRNAAFPLFLALKSDFPFLIGHVDHDLLDEEQISSVYGLFRWLLTTLRGWEPKSDPRNENIAAAIIIAQANHAEGSFWEAMPSDVLRSRPLVARLKTLVSALGVEFQMAERDATGIWEREAVQTLVEAEARQDWAAIAEAWRPFERALRPAPFHIQIVQFLASSSVGDLSAALGKTRQIAVATLVAMVLDDRRKLLLALECDNPFIEFACADTLLKGQPPASTALPDSVAELLTALLRKIANRDAQWKGWMTAFNKYPVRRPLLQASLGTALAHSPPKAILEYVTSISLSPQQSPTEPSRACASECLRTFKVHASQEVRAQLWRAAYERWKVWNFNADKTDQLLLSVCWSALDYAVIGYLVECLDDDTRIQMVNDAVIGLRAVETEWQPSLLALKSAWFRFASKLQLYAHSQQAGGSSDDWLANIKPYLPPDLLESRYVAIRFEAH